MVLNDEQVNRFFDTMDALLYYVNDKFRVVKGFTLDSNSMIDEVKASMVAAELWSNVEIIDEFVRENPYRLPKRCLDVALSWKNALPGFYTLVRYQQGRALLMGEAGVFSVSGVTYELEDEIGPAPAGVEMVLIPFDDEIVYDGFLQAYDTDAATGGEEARKIQDEFETRCAQGIVSDARAFEERARAFLDEKRNRELDQLLEDAASELRARDEGETLPAGFHRGALAGLSGMERDDVVDAYNRDRLRTLPGFMDDFDRELAFKCEPVTSLSDCLALMTRERLRRLGDALNMSGLSRLRKGDLVREIAAEIVQAPGVLRGLLVEYSGGTFETLRRIYERGPIVFPVDERVEHLDLWPQAPYAFMFRGKEEYTVLIPDEILPMMEALDFSAVESERRKWRQALSVANAAVTLYGLLPIGEAYECYRSLCPEAMDEDGFREMLFVESLYGGEGVFDLWQYAQDDYLTHFTLGIDYQARRVMESHFNVGEGVRYNSALGQFRYPQLDGLTDRTQAELMEELANVERYKCDLAEMRAQVPAKPLSRRIFEQDVLGALEADPSVNALRSFIDERIPDGEDDYHFADRVCEEVVVSSIESGNLVALFDYVRDLGLEGCCADEKRLVQLVTNVYNAMPSWENNGWSPQELYEQMTGRKVFYNADGSVKHVGLDDPCPCGSGKKYRDCCGA